MGVIDPDGTGSGGDANVKKIEDGVNKIPIDESGEIDKEKLNSSIFFVKSKSQERIDEIKITSTIKELEKLQKEYKINPLFHKNPAPHVVPTVQ